MELSSGPKSARQWCRATLADRCYCAGIVVDITERKRAEEGLRLAQAELAHVIASR